MAQASYSFLDVAALDGVRQRFAMGDALVILSADLEEVIWANGPGAALLGHDDVETILGAQTPLGPAAKRQIAALRGFPAIGRDCTLLVRVTLGVSSGALRFLASSLTLPDGEAAILLASPAAEAMREEARAGAIGGFSEPGHFVAFIDRAGVIETASADFDRLGLTRDALVAIVSEASNEDRIVKRLIPARRGPLPAGLARLTDDSNLIVVVDENWEATLAEANQQTDTETPADAEHEIWQLGSEHFAGAGEDTGLPQAPETVAPGEEPDGEDRRADGPAPEQVSESDLEKPPETEPAEIEAEEVEQAETASEEEAVETAAIADVVVEPPTSQEQAEVEQVLEAETPAAQVRRAAGPARFVWRTDAEGQFSQLSAELAGAVGVEATDIIGRRFQDVASAFGLDPTGEIAGLLARRDTWSGRTVSWPMAGTDLRVPVDLAALPVYDRNRDFQGFRGFGVARPSEASVDPAGTGLALPRIPRREEIVPDEPAARQDTQTPPSSDVELTVSTKRDDSADPFRGEAPAIEVTPVPDRRQSDKIIRLAERRPTTAERVPPGDEKDGAERVLSTGERIAFEQIGERLKQDSARAEPDGAEERIGETDTSESEAGTADIAGDEEDIAQPVFAEEAGVRPEEDEESTAEAIAELLEIDGATEDQLPKAEANGPAGQTTDASPEPSRRRAARPGMSLLDYAQWNKDEPASQQPAPVEMEEAAALDERIDISPEIETEATDPDAHRHQAEADDDDAVLAEVDLSPSVQQTIEAFENVAGAEPTETAAAPGFTKPDAGLSILEKLPVPVLVHSGDVLHYANDEFFALTGYGSIENLTKAGGIGALFADPYEDESGEERGARTDRHLRLKTRDGLEFPVEAFLQSIPWQDGKALVLVLSRAKTGLSGQSPLIAELEARVQEMRTIIDTATDGVVLIAGNGDIRSISRPAEALFGMDSDEVAGRPFSTLFAIESQKAARDYLAGLSDHGVASVLNDGREVIGREAEGRFIPLFMTIGKLPGDSGYCAVVRDITQWKRAEEELTQARAIAERASTHKSEFLARVSHEIRTPLNAIIGFSELMMDEKFGPVANDRYRDYLRDINRSGNHVLDLVNDLLDISKIEAGQQEMSYEAVSLNETLAETVAMMQPQANRERVIIRSSFASRLPDVVADLRSVRQIALNVLSNAVRYTQAGGQVIVSTAYESHGDVVLRVRDTGIGMTPAEIEQALKPFKQINSLKRTRGDGTGLGLPLTKAMVEANRAKFSIHSTPGEGTLVEVAFPSTRVLAD